MVTKEQKQLAEELVADYEEMYLPIGPEWAAVIMSRLLKEERAKSNANNPE